MLTSAAENSSTNRPSNMTTIRSASATISSRSSAISNAQSLRSGLEQMAVDFLDRGDVEPPGRMDSDEQSWLAQHLATDKQALGVAAES